MGYQILVDDSRITGAAQLASSPTFTGEVSAPDVKVTGLTGADSAPGRFVGVTALGAPTSGTFAVGDFVVTQNGHTFVCVTAGSPGSWVNPRELSNLLTVGEESFSREIMANSGAVAPSSGQLRLTYFTCRKSETTTQVRILTGSTAAAATPSLCRIGLYSVASNGNLTLVASTANDTTLFASAGTAYTRSWTTPYAKVAGQRYAVGPLVVSAATMPNFAGAVVTNSTEATTAPYLSANLTSQSDLPASITSASLAASGQRGYLAILP